MCDKSDCDSNNEKRACLGSETLSVRHFSEHFEQCLQCEMLVRQDLADHPFFGFKAACGDVD